MTHSDSFYARGSAALGWVPPAPVVAVAPVRSQQSIVEENLAWIRIDMYIRLMGGKI
jgi:hypothetical protein